MVLITKIRKSCDKVVTYPIMCHGALLLLACVQGTYVDIVSCCSSNPIVLTLFGISKDNCLVFNKHTVVVGWGAITPHRFQVYVLMHDIELVLVLDKSYSKLQCLIRRPVTIHRPLPGSMLHNSNIFSLLYTILQCLNEDRADLLFRRVYQSKLLFPLHRKVLALSEL